MIKGVYGLLWLGQLGVAIAVALLTANFCHVHSPAGGGYMVTKQTYEIMLVLVLGWPLLWMCGHTLQGLLLGVAGRGGNVKECVQMGFILGLAMGIAKLWLPVLGVGVGILIGGGGNVYAGLALVLGLLLFGLHRLIVYFWNGAERS